MSQTAENSAAIPRQFGSHTFAGILAAACVLVLALTGGWLAHLEGERRRAGQEVRKLATQGNLSELQQRMMVDLLVEQDHLASLAVKSASGIGGVLLCILGLAVVDWRRQGRRVQKAEREWVQLRGQWHEEEAKYRSTLDQRKRLAEELLQSQKMEAVGRLAGGIAHDFNNILTTVLGYSDLLIGQVDEKHWMYKDLSEIRKAGDFATSLTHQLLAFSRRQPLFPRVFHINDTVKNMQPMLQRAIGENVQIHTQFQAGIGRLKADPSQLEQVLLKLCMNARDAMPKGGSITIQTADVTYSLDDCQSVNEMPAGEYVKLTVADAGTGMTDEVKKHMFEPFFTTKEKGQGTGLGLATCYGIIKQSGGYISVQTAVGVGTTFSIYLPQVDESGEKASIRKEAGQLPGGDETVLYVEDEITLRNLTAQILRRLGYTVIEAGSGSQARDAVESHDVSGVDLLFSDVVLPDAGGKDLADWIRSSNSGRTRMLFTSGYVDEGVLRRHGIEAGAAFLQKPFTPTDLARKVREVLDAA